MASAEIWKQRCERGSGVEVVGDEVERIRRRRSAHALAQLRHPYALGRELEVRVGRRVPVATGRDVHDGVPQSLLERGRAPARESRPVRERVGQDERDARRGVVLEELVARHSRTPLHLACLR